MYKIATLLFVPELDVDPSAQIGRIFAHDFLEWILEYGRPGYSDSHELRHRIWLQIIKNNLFPI